MFASLFGDHGWFGFAIVISSLSLIAFCWGVIKYHPKDRNYHNPDDQD